VDVNFSVTERASGNLLFGVGYGQDSGILLNLSLNQNNFLGTGNQFSVVFNNSTVNTNYSLYYNNPYYTPSGISRGFRLYYQRTDPGQANAANYTADTQGAQISFGFPLNEFDTLLISPGYQGVTINTNSKTPLEIFAYLAANGDNYNNFLLQSSWSRDRRNRTVLADRGTLNRVQLEIAMPGGDQEYYKLDYRLATYYPLTKNLTFAFLGQLAYGDGYGKTKDLPFYENFFAGGLRTVRGYKTNTLGPRYINGEASGGSFRTVANAEVIFPVPFMEESNNVRLAAFVDAGNVYSSLQDFDAGQLRYSAGVTGLWLSPFGPFVVSLAAPLNAQSGDKREPFQFSFGVPLF
jgi:outer membrane protein insertion porin family